MSLRIPGMNGSSENQGQPLSGSGGLDLSADLNDPNGGLLSDASADAFAAPAAPGSRKSNASVLILIAVVVVAGGALYAMRHIGMTGLPEFDDDVTIDYPLERSDKKFEEDYQTLLANLRSSDEVVQVPLTEVVMNPFTWKGEAEAIPAGPIGNGPNSRELERTRIKEQRTREISFVLGRIRFTGVMGGRVKSATVNGQLVRVGDTVADFLRVSEIGDREIKLVAIPFQHTLASGEQVTITPDTAPHILSLDVSRR